MIKGHLKFVGKAMVTIAVISIVWLGVNKTLVAKKFIDQGWPETTTASEFYKLEKNSVDVLFLGSSHAVSSFIPQELYNRYGITSYNLGTEQQSIVISYYWLKEALQTQNPEVVILDTYVLFPYQENEPLNSAEAAIRLAMDFMKWGKVKCEAVRDICRLDKEQSVLSYYLTNIRYHTRWKSLVPQDFLYGEYVKMPGLMGYSTASHGAVSDTYKPLEPGSSDDKAEMVPLMKEYLEKIIDLCRQRKIELILVKTPTTLETIQKYNTLNSMYKSHHVPFYDFNEASLYEKTGFSFVDDMVDDGHLGLSGGQKITNYLGEILQTKYKMQPHQSETWEKTREIYEEVQTNERLSKITDFHEYLSVLEENLGRYTVFITVRDEASAALGETAQLQLRNLGLTADWSGAYRKSYYAIIESGLVQEEVMSADKLESKGAFLQGETIYSIVSAGAKVGNMCSVKIETTEYSVNKRGMNFVVYDNERRTVIDKVCFDTCSEELTAVR